jgi:hypothetical protein
VVETVGARMSQMATNNLCITPELTSGGFLQLQNTGEEVTGYLATPSHFHTS